MSLKEYRSCYLWMTKCAHAIHSSFIHHLVEIFNPSPLLAGTSAMVTISHSHPFTPWPGVHPSYVRIPSSSEDEGSLFKIVIYTSLSLSLDYYGTGLDWIIIGFSLACKWKWKCFYPYLPTLHTKAKYNVPCQCDWSIAWLFELNGFHPLINSCQIVSARVRLLLLLRQSYGGFCCGDGGVIR
jgi:hypothetical protein